MYQTLRGDDIELFVHYDGGMELKSDDRGRYVSSKAVSNSIVMDNHFDPHWYTHSYHPTAYALGGDNSITNSNVAAEHYLNVGAGRNYDPSPLFSTQRYLN